MSNDAQRVLDQLFCTSKAVPNAYPQVTKDQCGQNISARLGNCCSIAEAGNNKSFIKPRPRILQPHFLSKEGKFILETNHRLIKTEQVHKPGKIQNGDHRVNQSDITVQRLGRFHRPKGCLLSHSGGKEAPKVSPVYPQRSCISICSPPIRVVHRSNDIHPCHERSEDHAPQNKRGDSHVPGRLALKGKVSSATSKKFKCHIRYLRTARSRSKRRKIRAHSDSEIHLSGISVQHQLRHGLPTSNPSRGPDYISKPGSKTETNCKENDEPSGTHVLSRESHPMGKTAYERTAGRPAWSMAPGRITGKPDCPDTTFQSRLTMVEGRLKFGGRASTAPPTPQIELFTDSSTEGWGAHIESKTRSGLWSQEEKFLHINVLEMRAAHLAIRYFSQSLRNKIVLLASDNTSVVWYLKKQGGDEIEGPVPRGQAPIQHGHGTEDNSPGATCSRKAQCFSGPAVQKGPSTQKRMVNQPPDIQASVQDDGKAPHRLIRHSIQSQTSVIHVSDPRSESCSGRCSITGLDRDVGLRLSPSRNPTPSPLKDRERTVPGDFDCTSTTTSKLVSNATQPKRSNTNRAASDQKPAKTVSIRQGSYKPGCNETPRLVLIQQALQKRGFSGQVSRMVSSSVRPSTNKVYDTKWTIFAAWCEKMKVCASKASTPLVADFLAEKQTLAPTTVEGYRTAISNTIKHVRGRDITSDPCIQSLIRSNRLRNTVTKNDVPPWDLAVVLRYLSKSPFEPIESSTLKNLTIFLLALASGKRRGELQALTREGLSWNENKTVVTCRLDPSFEAKTQGRTGNPTSPIILHALSGFVGRDPDENLLCPVRSLLKYYTRVKLEGHVGNKKRLFVSINVGKKTTEIASPSITRWIKTVILDAHRLVKDQDLRLAGVKAHQVRAVATSLTFKNASLEQVLEMGGWTNHSTFTSYYLKDLSHQNENQYRLAPILTGNVVVRI